MGANNRQTDDDKKTLLDLVKETYKNLTDKDIRRLHALERRSRWLEKQLEEYRDLRSSCPPPPPPRSTYYEDQLRTLNRIQSNPMSNSLAAEIQRRSTIEAMNSRDQDPYDPYDDWKEHQQIVQGWIDKYSKELNEVNKELEELVLRIDAKNQTQAKTFSEEIDDHEIEDHERR